VIQVIGADSVSTCALIIGCRMLDSVSDDDIECAVSLAPLMDMVDIMQASCYDIQIHFCLATASDCGSVLGHCWFGDWPLTLMPIPVV